MSEIPPVPAAEADPLTPPASVAVLSPVAPTPIHSSLETSLKTLPIVTGYEPYQLPPSLSTEAYRRFEMSILPRLNIPESLKSGMIKVCKALGYVALEPIKIVAESARSFGRNLWQLASHPVLTLERNSGAPWAKYEGLPLDAPDAPRVDPLRREELETPFLTEEMIGIIGLIRERSLGEGLGGDGDLSSPVTAKEAKAMLAVLARREARRLEDERIKAEVARPTSPAGGASRDRPRETGPVSPGLVVSDAEYNARLLSLEERPRASDSWLGDFFRRQGMPLDEMPKLLKWSILGGVALSGLVVLTPAVAGSLLAGFWALPAGVKAGIGLTLLGGNWGKKWNEKVPHWFRTTAALGGAALLGAAAFPEAAGIVAKELWALPLWVKASFSGVLGAAAVRDVTVGLLRKAERSRLASYE